MKKISILILALVATICFNACVEDDEPTFVVQEDQATAPSIVTANSTVTLNKDIEGDQALTIVWNDAEYNFQTPVTYTIVAAQAGTEFENAIEAAVTTERSYTWTVSDLNDLAIKSGLLVDQEGAIEVRVISSLGSNGGVAMESNILILTLTPYSTELPRLLLPGNYAMASGYGADWAPQDAETPAVVAESFTSQVYQGYVYFANNDSKFKFITGPEWVTFPDYGFNGTEGTLVDGDGEQDIPVATAGYYRVTADLENLEYKLESMEWALTGSSTPLGFAPAEAGPDQDHDMVYDKDKRTWSVTLDLTAGEIKFRANDSWALNFGNDDNGDGSLDEGGSNITVDAGGTYIITLDLSNPRAYTYSLTPVTI